jgi:hypothetical protein
MAITKICPTCGLSNTPFSPFCSNTDCGVSLVAVAPSEQDDKFIESPPQKTAPLTKAVCPDCKADNEIGVDRCIYCDHDFFSNSDRISRSLQVELNWPWGKVLMTLPVRIGREPPAPECLINAIAAHGYYNISRSHAELSFDAITKELCLKDLGSSNGTFIDGVRIPSNMAIPLKSGTLVRFAANLTLIVVNNYDF